MSASGSYRRLEHRYEYIVCQFKRCTRPLVVSRSLCFAVFVDLSTATCMLAEMACLFPVLPNVCVLSAVTGWSVQFAAELSPEAILASNAISIRVTLLRCKYEFGFLWEKPMIVAGCSRQFPQRRVLYHHNRRDGYASARLCICNNYIRVFLSSFSSTKVHQAQHQDTQAMKALVPPAMQERRLLNVLLVRRCR